MKTATKMSKKEIVTKYAKLIRVAEKAWDLDEVTRLMLERNALLEQ
jgi:hypothetical protein